MKTNIVTLANEYAQKIIYGIDDCANRNKLLSYVVDDYLCKCCPTKADLCIKPLAYTDNTGITTTTCNININSLYSASVCSQPIIKQI